MNDEIHLKLLKILEKNPELTQRELAQILGVSLGKVNYCLRALKDKGWVKWGVFSNSTNKMQYAHLLTPAGLMEKVALTLRFLKRKEEEYENLKREIEALKQDANTPEENLEIIRVE